jgi:hypothetical protein
MGMELLSPFTLTNYVLPITLVPLWNSHCVPSQICEVWHNLF